MAEDEDENGNQSVWLSRVLNFKNGLLAIITVITAWNTYTTTVTNNDLQIVQAQLDTAKSKLEIQSVILANQSTELETDIRRREFGNNLKFKLYEEVRNAITENEPKIQDAVVLIINEMLADDSAYRAKLSNIILNSRNTAPSVKASIQTTQKLEAVFASEQVKTFTTVRPSGGNNRFVIDVFYLEDSKSESLPLAKKVESDLKAKFPENTIRVRMLPKSINARSSYGINTNQIRFEPGEKKFAEEIRLHMLETNTLSQLTAYVVKNKTPNYLSVFVKEK